MYIKYTTLKYSPKSGHLSQKCTEELGSVYFVFGKKKSSFFFVKYHHLLLFPCPRILIELTIFYHRLVFFMASGHDLDIHLAR